MRTIADSRVPHGRSLIWALVESGGLSLLSLAVLIVVARLAGPVELGAFAIALGIVQVLTLVIDMLMHDAIIQRPRLHAAHLDTAFWICAALGVLLSAACWAMAPVVADLFDHPSLAPLLSVGGLSLAFSGFACVPIALMRRDLRFKPLAVRSLGGRLAGAVVAIALIVGGQGVWALVAQHVVQVAVAAVLVWPASAWRPGVKLSGRCLRQLVSFGVFSVGTRLVWLAGGRVFVLLVGSLAGVAAVGYLNIAQRLVDTLFDLLAGAAHNLALPVLSRRQSDRPALIRTYKLATEFTALTTVPIFGGLALCAAPLISVLLGDGWLTAAPIVWVLALGALLQFVFLFGPTTLTALGRPGIVLAISLLSLSAAMVALFTIKPADPVVAAALWVGRIVIGGPLAHWVIARLLEISPFTIARAVWIPLAGAAAMAAVLLAVEHVWLTPAPAWIHLLILVPLGAAVYGATTAVLGRGPVMRLLQFCLSAVRRPQPPPVA